MIKYYYINDRNLNILNNVCPFYIEKLIENTDSMLIERTIIVQ